MYLYACLFVHSLTVAFLDRVSPKCHRRKKPEVSSLGGQHRTTHFPIFPHSPILSQVILKIHSNINNAIYVC